MSAITKSAALPTSMLPTVADMSSAAAPFSVAAVIASSGVMCICVQAMVIIIGIENDMHEPGLKSLAIATATPASMSFRAGA